MTSRFERDTTPTPQGPGRYGCEMDRGWWIVNGPNGGYLAAVLLRAIEAEVAEAARTPRSLTVHYLRPPQEGPVEIQVSIERSGRTVSTATARLAQAGKLQLLATASLSTRSGGADFQHSEMPEVPGPDEAPSQTPPSEGMHSRYDRRWVIGSTEWGQSARGECGGWIRLADPAAYDAPLIAALCDAWPPSIFQLDAPGISGGAPTVDLTIYFRSPERVAALRPEDWVFSRFASRTGRAGFVEEDGELWSRDGVLLAQSRQLAVFSRPAS